MGISNQPGQWTLTVTSEDLTILMDLEEKTGTSFAARPHAAQVGEIISKYSSWGIVPLVIPELFPDTPMPTARIPFQQGTDLGYLNELAKANGYVFYLDPGPVPGMSKAYWGPEVRIGVPQHALSVNMDGLSTVDQLTFSFDGSAREDLEARVQIPGTRVSTVLPVPEVSVLRPPLALKPAPALKKKVLKDTANKDTTQVLAETLAQIAESADADAASPTTACTSSRAVRTTCAVVRTPRTSPWPARA